MRVFLPTKLNRITGCAEVFAFLCSGESLESRVGLNVILSFSAVLAGSTGSVKSVVDLKLSGGSSGPSPSYTGSIGSTVSKLSGKTGPSGTIVGERCPLFSFRELMIANSRI